MNFRMTSHMIPGPLAVVLLFLCIGGVSVSAKDSHYEASLVWASNAETSPNPRHKTAPADMLRKLRELPLKWKNYFVVTNTALTLPPGSSREAALSEKCRIQVKNIDARNVEVSLIGKGEPILKRMQPLPRGDMLILGGNAPDETGWLVVVKRIE